MKNILLLAFTLFIFTTTVNAQKISFPSDTNFYNPTIAKFNKTIEKPDNVEDNFKQLQTAIDAVAKAGGGTLTIKASSKNNVYKINKEIQLKSNVHIRVAPNVIFTSSSPRKITLFSAGKKGTTLISNFSMSCTNPKSYFTVDFSKRISGEKNGGAIAVSLGGVENFKISDIHVKDNFTSFSSITINLQLLSKTKFLFANNGIIEHLKTENGHYGYGTVQNQAGINILYRNLQGEGGATLRLETGAIGKPHAIDNSIKLHNIYAYNIFCKNGQAAVTLSPHTVDNGLVTIDNVRAESCEAGAIIASGFLSAKKGEKNKQGAPMPGYQFGYFDSNSIISNLTVVYGTNAQLRSQRRGFVPCSQRKLLAQKRNIDNESFKGPTVAGIIYFAKGGTEQSEGFYTIKMPNFKMEGFPLVDGVMENKEYVASNNELLNNCSYSGIVKIQKHKKKKNKNN
ncbi:glycoside hydrolase family protein [Lutibacter citreus]|uniref:hypothetical protein n=1 Tax=Lutibacter citreus TaxID=2138210 RepID=UPI000DBE0173|nr:hypothetical protein [Lutibacter citreus]